MAEADRYLHALFCDDIREEVGGKYSLMGMYGSDLLVTTAGVLTLPKLCVVVRAVSAIERPFQALTVQVLRDTEGSEVELATTGAIQLPPAPEFPPDARTMDVQVMLVMSPFATEQDCVLRVRASTESGPLEAAPLRVRLMPQTPPPGSTRH